jgi:cellulose biosynthesis protein BcsQ
VKTIAFFNTKGGVGKTTLVYHVTWMCAELGQRVLAVDLDPQANLTALFLDEESLDELWSTDGHSRSVSRNISPIIDGTGDVADCPIQEVSECLHLLPGDPGLARLEDKLAKCWFRCMDGEQAACRAIAAFNRIIQGAASRVGASFALVDVGSNLGAINRAALLASSHVVIPLAPGPYSLQGLENLGLTLENWRNDWARSQSATPPGREFSLPADTMEPAGYVIMQHVERGNRRTNAYDRWVSKVPGAYEKYILRNSTSGPNEEVDRNRIGTIKNYRSLTLLSEEARKPIFKLKPADGAIGAHAAAVSKCYMDFKNLTEEILRRVSEEATQDNE